MTTNEELTRISIKDDIATDDYQTEQQLIALRNLLKLPPEERQAILAVHASIIAEYFESGSDEMEWAEEYVEDENWDDE